MSSALDVDRITDWNTRLMGRVAEQWKDDPFVIAFVGALAEQVQQLEEAQQDLLTLPSVDDSMGAQLDVIGAIVGQPRGGIDDATFRLYLRARIRANKSSGTRFDFVAVLQALFGLGLAVTFTDSYPAGVVVRILSPTLTAAQITVVWDFLRAIKSDGVRLWFEYQCADDPDTFAFEGSWPGKGFANDTDQTEGGKFVDALGNV